MKIIKDDGALVIKSWCENPEEGSIEQARNLARLPFAFRQICLMPDTHQGYGMPIGGVLATKRVVVPNAVGVDIGCGMCAVRTSITELPPHEVLADIITKIKRVIPVGFRHQPVSQDIDRMPESDNVRTVVSQEFHSAMYQLGTLGGGNHFIELQWGDDGHMWVMIHSGSRNLGKKVADHYNKVAIELNGRWYSSVPASHQLAFLPHGTDEYDNYIAEMRYCVDFAYANRKLMMDRIKEGILDIYPDVQFLQEINIAHNYAAMENHFGENVLVHRKGATQAKFLQLGIIPGSQGTKSYIVRGLGNPESFESCSHGAGRRMGRKEATRILNLEDEIKKLDDQGIIHNIHDVKDLDEAAGAYKDIDVVMKEQYDLVEILVELRPLAVVKG